MHYHNTKGFIDPAFSCFVFMLFGFTIRLKDVFFFSFSGFLVNVTVCFVLLKIFIILYRKSGKVHPRTRHEDPEGE